MNKYPFVFYCDNVKVFVHCKVMVTWNSFKQISPKSNEAFGALIGYCDKENNSIFIRMITEPYPLDKATRSSFTLVDPKHQNIVSKAFRRSHSLLGYLGTWHTHPEFNPNPSNIDINDWNNCILRNTDRSLFFFIIGKDQPYLFQEQYKRYIKIKGNDVE